MQKLEGFFALTAYPATKRVPHFSRVLCARSGDFAAHHPLRTTEAAPEQGR
jgi:hypothetical protein